MLPLNFKISDFDSNFEFNFDCIVSNFFQGGPFAEKIYCSPLTETNFHEKLLENFSDIFLKCSELFELIFPQLVPIYEQVPPSMRPFGLFSLCFFNLKTTSNSFHMVSYIYI